MLLLLLTVSANAADLQSIALEISFSPVLRQTTPETLWEFGFALTGQWSMDDSSVFDISLASGFEAISPRLSFMSRWFLDRAIALGGGAVFSWTDRDWGPHVFVSVLALGGIHADLTDEFMVSAELQQTILGVNRTTEEWQWAPAMPIPRLTLCGQLTVFPQSAMGGRLVLEPLWIEPRTLEDPVRPASEHVVLHPAFAFLLDTRPAIRDTR